jgi:hypothetical protein
MSFGYLYLSFSNFTIPVHSLFLEVKWGQEGSKVVQVGFSGRLGDDRLIWKRFVNLLVGSGERW